MVLTKESLTTDRWTQLTLLVNSCEQHTSHVTQLMTRTRVAQVASLASHSMCHLHALMLCVWFSSTSLSSRCCPSLSSPCPCPATSSSTMWWTNSLCILANAELGTLPKYDPLATSWRTQRFCGQMHLTRHFSHAICAFNYMHITLHDSRWATQRVCVRASIHLHVVHDVCLSVRCLSLRVRPSCFSPLFTSSLPHSTCTLPNTSSPMSSTPREVTAAFALWGVLLHGDIPSSHRVWAQRPRRLPQLRDICNDLPGWIWRHRYGVLVLCNVGLDDETIGEAPTVHWGATRTSEPETSLSLSWRKFVASSVLASHTQERRNPYTNLVRFKNESQAAKWKTNKSRFSFKDKKSKFSLKSEPRFRNMNFKPFLMGEVFRNWMELSNLSEETLIMLLQVTNNFDEINNSRENREAHVKCFHEMEELKRVQESRVGDLSRRRLIV